MESQDQPTPEAAVEGTWAGEAAEGQLNTAPQESRPKAQSFEDMGVLSSEL